MCSKHIAQRSLIPVATRPSRIRNSSDTSSNPNLVSWDGENDLSQLEIPSTPNSLSTNLKISKSETSLYSKNDFISANTNQHYEQAHYKTKRKKPSSDTISSDVSTTDYSSKRQQVYSASSSSNLKIKIYHSSSKNSFKESSETNDDCATSKGKEFQSSEKKCSPKTSTLKLVNPNKRTLAVGNKCSNVNNSHQQFHSSKSIQRSGSNQGSKLDLLSSPSEYTASTEQQLTKQLKEKDTKILELMERIDEKQEHINSLYFVIDEKDEKILELINEIKKRKQDLTDLSRRIFDLDRELKLYQGRHYDYETIQFNRPLSQLSFESSKSDRTVKNRWLKMISMSKTLIKPKPKKSPSQKSSDEYVEELKSMLQEKEMTITDLRLESKITNHRLEELENTLRKREEETYLIRKNNDYFEKVIKSKLID